VKQKRNLVLLLAVLTISVLLSACYAGSNNSTPPAEQQHEPGYPLTITDFLEREITIEKAPERIVSLAPSTTEILFALGAGEKVVGVTDYDDYPEEVKKLPKVGGFKGPNMEAIAAQNPDIVFASSLSGKSSMEALENLGIPVVVLEAKGIQEIYKSIEILGRITGTAAEGEKLFNEMKSKLDTIKEKVSGLSKPKVFYIVDLNGNYTAGKGTFIDELINLAGGLNVAGEAEGWVQYSVEKIVEQNPDIIITAPHAGDINSIKTATGYKETEAVKNDRVFVVSDDNIISRASYRIVQGLEEIAKYLHPEAF